MNATELNWNVSQIVTTIVLLIALILMFAVLWQERKGNMNKPPNPHDDWREKQALDGSKYWLHRTQTKNAAFYDLIDDKWEDEDENK